MDQEPSTEQETPPLTLSDVAVRFNVSTQTVRDWSNRGLLPHFRTPGGQRRFRADDVERFIKDQEPAA